MHIDIYMYMYIYIYTCTYMCAPLCIQLYGVGEQIRIGNASISILLLPGKRGCTRAIHLNKYAYVC